MTPEQQNELLGARAKTQATLDEVAVLLKPIYTRLADIKERLKTGCDRTCGTVKHKSDYNNGSYYDSPYTIHWESCSVCGYYKELPTENHGRYSG